MCDKKDEFMRCILDLGNDAIFDYNGKKAGLSSQVKNYVFSFQVWYGNQTKEYGTVELETIMADPFFDGKSINDLLEEITIYFV